MKKNLKEMLVVGLLLCTIGVSTGTASVLVADNFNRADSNTLGTMSDGVHSWVEQESNASRVTITGNQLVATYDGNGENGAAVNGFTLADGTIQVTVASIDWVDRFANIAYRGADYASASGLGTGYHVFIWQNWGSGSGHNDVELRYGSPSGVTTLLAYADAGTGMFPGNTVFDVSFNGNTHSVSMNGTPILSYTETTSGRTGAGYIGLGNSYAQVIYDDFSVSAIPEPMTLVMLSLGGFFVRKRG